MIKYAKVINEETKECQVGLGTNSQYYIAQGFTEQDVEKCEWNGSWYLAGYVPEKPEEMQKQERINELKFQLNQLDDKSTRSIRAILAETATEEDRNYLANLEEQAEQVREELKELIG